MANLPGCPVRRALAGRPQSTSPQPGLLSRSSSVIAMPFAIAPRAPDNSKGLVMSKRENNANNIFRPSDSPLTEYEKEQISLRKNLERLKAERLAREAANSKKD
jgi:hypothetical protein